MQKFCNGKYKGLAIQYIFHDCFENSREIYIYIYIYIIIIIGPDVPKLGFRVYLARGSAPPIRTTMPKGESMGRKGPGPM